MNKTTSSLSTTAKKLSTALLPTIISTLSINTIEPQIEKPSSLGNTNNNNNEQDEYLNRLTQGDLTDKYRPEVGIRTALILASMLFFIVVYLLWRNRCRCLLRRNGSSSSDDLDMEFWLKHVDKQKAALKRSQYNAANNVTPVLPDIGTDPKQATAAWILEHRKIWTSMNRVRVKSGRTHDLAAGLDHLLLANSPIPRNFSRPNQLQTTHAINESSRGGVFVNRLLNPFRKLANRKSRSNDRSQVFRYFCFHMILTGVPKRLAV